MDNLTPLTPGMSSLLYFGDETFEYPAPEIGNNSISTPGIKDQAIDGERLIEIIEPRRLRSSTRKSLRGDSANSVQTPALTTGPSALYPNSTSASQASPSLAPDYFSRPRQPNSDGSVAHFNTNKLGESSDFSEFRKAIDNRFNVARNTRGNDFNDPSCHPPAAEEHHSFAPSEFTSQPAGDGEFQRTELAVAFESVIIDSKHDFPPLNDPARFQYPEVDPALESGPFVPAPETNPLPKPPTAEIPPSVIKNDAPKVIKRRRRRKAPPSAEVQAQKHKAFLERNREAASKCRTKKKTQVHQLEEREREGRALNLLLKEEFKIVLGEVLLYREQLKILELACGGECRAKLTQSVTRIEESSMEGLILESDRKLEYQGLVSPVTGLEGSTKWESGSESVSNVDDKDYGERRRKSQSNKSMREGIET